MYYDKYNTKAPAYLCRRFSVEESSVERAGGGQVKKRIRKGWKVFKKQKELQLFAWLGMLVLFIFSYLPLSGIIIAFKDYRIQMGISGIWTADWVGFKWFRELFSYYRFPEILRNTIILSVLKLIFTFPAPIILALLLNEMKVQKFKKVVQTVTYLPNFISWILVYTIAESFLNADMGLINQVLQDWGIIRRPIQFLTSPSLFWGVSVFLAVWKSTGYWAIIFLAAISGIDSQLYEAAQIDGAGRLQRIRYITLPGIRGSVVTVLILSIGGLLGGGMGGSNFDQSYIFGNSLNNATSEILQTYSFTMGLSEGRFAYATAADLIQSLVSVVLILVSNQTAKKIAGEGIF